jgi:hypothetical protein
MSNISNKKTALLSLWIVGAVVASFAVMPSMAFASSSYDEGKKSCDTCSQEKTATDNNNGGGTVSTQTYEGVKTKTTTTDIHKQITKKEIVGTKTTITTKVTEDENGDNGEAAAAAAEANGSSISGGECNCITDSGDNQQYSDKSNDDSSDDSGKY